MARESKDAFAGRIRPRGIALWVSA